MTGIQRAVEGREFRGRALFPFAVAAIGCFYFILVPFACYLCQTVMTAHGAEMPRGIAWLNPLSPLLPLTIGALGIGLLLWARVSAQENLLARSILPASAIAILFGASWAAFTLLPVVQLMEAIRG